MTEVVSLSTPSSKSTSVMELPSTPSKKPELPDIEQFALRNFTPSKPYRFSRPAIKISASPNIVPQRLSLDTNAIDEEGNASPTSYEGSLSRKLSNDSHSISPVSECGSVSPFCDAPSLPSTYSPELVKDTGGRMRASSGTGSSSYLDPFNVDNFIWNTQPFANKDAFELNKMIHSTLAEYKNRILSETRPRVRKQQLQSRWARSSSRSSNNSSNSHYEKVLKHVPCHHYNTPRRSILRVAPGSLNLLVSSSRGSLQDATIFATEINATVNNRESRLPLITNIWERITIPVNSEIKKKYKKIKTEWYHDDNYDESEDDEVFKFEDSEEFYGAEGSTEGACVKDAALIRGFEFDAESCASAAPRRSSPIKKSLRWASVLEQ